MAITSNITLRSDLTPSRHIPQDDFLSADNLQKLNEGTDLHGVMFGGAHELYGMINPIALSARHFLSHPDANEKQQQHDHWERKIKSWTYQSPHPISLTSQQQPFNPPNNDFELAALIYQKTLLIYLYSMYNGTATPSPSLISKIDTLVLQTFHLIALLPRHTYVRTTMMWNCIVCSSCVRSISLRKMLIQRAEMLPYTMVSAKRAYEFLILLWSEMDGDENVYGLWGVERTMRKFGIQFSCVWTICCGEAPMEREFGVEVPDVRWVGRWHLRWCKNASCFLQLVDVIMQMIGCASLMSTV